MKKLLLILLLFSCTATFAQQSPVANATSMAKAKATLARVKPALLNMRARLPHNRNVDASPGPVSNNSSRKFVAPTPSTMPGGQSSSDVQKRTIVEPTATEASIGYTYYDLQTNNTISNRLVNNSDGTLSAVWILGPTNDASTGYPDRGTGYNYFNGTSWLPEPTSRIEQGEGSFRSGFQNIGVTSTGEEIVIGHGFQPAGNNLGIISSTRQNKGTGPWFTTDTLLGAYPSDTLDCWPKMATGGPDGQSIHAIWRAGEANDSYYGQTAPILYSNSTNNGATWSLDNILWPLDSTYYTGFSADEYSIDVNGSNIAVVAGDYGEDVVLAKSIDNGNTWTQEIVYQFPIPFFNSHPDTYTTDTVFPYTGPADTLWTGTGDPTVVIDNNGLAHVFFSMFRVIKTNASADSSFDFPNTALLFYWNENMATNEVVAIAGVPNLTGDSTLDLPANDPSDCSEDPFPYGTYGTFVRILEEPSAGVDTSNNLYVCYQTVDELSNPEFVSNNYNKDFKHPYLIKSTDGGNTWTNSDSAYDVLRATQLGNSDNLEGVYACMARHVDSQIHITYQRDPYPGTSLAATGSCEYNMNINDSSSIIYVSIDTSLTPTGINQLPAKSYGLVVSSNFPNPATTSTQFNVTLSTTSNVNINVTDMLGQNVYSENRGRLSPGSYNITLNTAYLSAGVYFYTVTAGDEKITNKMVVR